jgi:type I restriction-modification system DNA methylase subunit
MKKKLDDVRVELFNHYFGEISKICRRGGYREESFYYLLKQLVEECSKVLGLSGVGVMVSPSASAGGSPDFRVDRDGGIVGYLEAKLPGEDLSRLEDSEQVMRYRNTFPNFILTNFSKFILYRNGDCVDVVDLGFRSGVRGSGGVYDVLRVDLFFGLMEKFFSFEMPVIADSNVLARDLAKRTRWFVELLREEFLKGNNKELRNIYEALKQDIDQDLSEEKFIDIYAQTVAYGLFAARMGMKGGDITRENAWRYIPAGIPVVREMFHLMSGPVFPESLGWVVDDMIALLRNVDIGSILAQVRNAKWDEDPIIHFYETFLSAYNPEERDRLGVYYTPLPVVMYIVRSVHKLLKERFGKEEGLAARDVTLLDPCAGTLTFVVQAIKQVFEELKGRRKEGLMGSYIREHILQSFYAFEILIAPYVIGHFKVNMVLEDLGYKLKDGERFRFYLTNALEMRELRGRSLLMELVEEEKEAKRVKESVPILVVIGNPPYSFQSMKSEFIDGLMESYKEDVRGEKKLGVLEDNYIKFIRFAHWKIEQAGRGVIGFITNNSYLSGIIHRGMRRKLLETFDEIYILNLHGSSRIDERPPAGKKNENVFDIQQGVAISLFVKLENPLREKRVYYVDLWGSREEKYRYLSANDVSTTKWKRLRVDEFERRFKATRWGKKYPSGFNFFIPSSARLLSEYGNFWGLDEIFIKWDSGVQTGQDDLVVGFTSKELEDNILFFADAVVSEEEIEKRFGKRGMKEWDLSKVREKIRGEQVRELIRRYHYRPWDFRYIYYSHSLVWRRRESCMKHLLNGENIVLITTRKIEGDEEKGAFVTNEIGDLHIISGVCYFFPLYLLPEERLRESSLLLIPSEEKVPNLSGKFMEAIGSLLGRVPPPEDILGYIYGVLYSPVYHARYNDLLKIDFPRIPLPSNRDIYKRLREIGKRLIRIHLLEFDVREGQFLQIGFPVAGENMVERVRYDRKGERVYINSTQFFDGVPEEVWEYKIGAVQVMRRFLEGRKGRRLDISDIEHYIKMGNAIWLTIQLQNEIKNIDF